MPSRYDVTVPLDVLPRRLPSTSLLAAGMLALLSAACGGGPPPDFAPDPGLVGRIRELRVTPLATQACPGQGFRVAYEAVLDDGSRVPFENRYDKKNPPRLHVQFLQRSSREAVAQGDGSFYASPDPLLAVLTGYRVEATLIAKPSVSGSARLDPSFDCMSHAYTYRGPSGYRPSGRDSEGRSGGPGGDGPDVTVRLGVVRSPYVPKLLVAAIEVGEAPAQYYVADANSIQPRDWLLIETQGGTGGRGADGAKGTPGMPGAQGCPGGPGAPGGNGQNGGTGGLGGRGGRITIITASEDPFLAGLVDARNPGGPGGEGGKGGAGGPGGAGGAGLRPECAAGPAGAAGREGAAGQPGPRGYTGTRAQVITVPLREVFGQNVPPELAELLNQRR